VDINKMKEKIQPVGTLRKSNPKIVETEVNAYPNIYKHNPSLSWIGAMWRRG
jgi:hypothetical protein